MVSLTPHVPSTLSRPPPPSHPLFLCNPKLPSHLWLTRGSSLPLTSPLKRNITTSTAFPFISSSLSQQQPRTLFPGGYKRPEIRVPNVVLLLSSHEVFEEDKTRGVLDVLDKAIASSVVGIVVLRGGGARGGKLLYEAACVLKSVIKDRAYLLIEERVDIAAAVNASGVLLSDQGLPAIVARNTMIDSKSESVVLPLVARTVETPSAALDASTSEGADFLIYTICGDSHKEDLVSSLFQRVRIPTFIMVDSLVDEKSFHEALNLVKSGASGLVVSLPDLKLLGSDDSNKLYESLYVLSKRMDGKVQKSDEMNMLDVDNGSSPKVGVAGFAKLEERERQLVETERSLLLDARDVIQQAAPLMEEVSLLMDAVSQLDEPFLLVIVGEFNSGKSTVINALLGEKYLSDGVVPTTNEITFLRYSKEDVHHQHRCERHPDGQILCYLPAPILKDMIIVDTPGTNVILQRQQRLTEEFVPRADLILFVMSADRPLTESEVTFLRYTQQWKKKVVFVLNKSDLYQNTSELQEAISFIEENARKLLNTEIITLYPVSARCALEAKLSAASNVSELGELYRTSSHWKISSFFEFEDYLYSFLDGTTSTGIERIKLKLGTPLGIAERLLSSCQKLVREEYQRVKLDLASLNNIVDGVKDYAHKMKSESTAWERQLLSLVNSAQERAIQLLESTLQLSNLDIVTSYVFKGGNSAPMPVTSTVQNDIIGPAASQAKNIVGEYVIWLQSSNAREGRVYKEALAQRWSSLVDPHQVQLHKTDLLGERGELSVKVLEDFSASAASKLFEQEIREVFLGTFGGLGAAGLSASLLTSVLPTTLEDLLALGLCSAGGLLAISNFPARKRLVVDKVKRAGDALARELEGAMQKDLLETINNLEKYVRFVGEPYQDVMQHRLDELAGTSDELIQIEKKLQTLRIEIENLHV
ncbi:probable transmembrane GTPase FZO-like, chloroplastic [Coffea arabica]|uniref:Probable transmembrane GTPase FZO-like, chloroplastic n=1 Tax=Coffea arabica TaxID=13443 RepID=A0ABM4VXJ0_COFAR